MVPVFSGQHCDSKRRWCIAVLMQVMANELTCVVPHYSIGAGLFLSRLFITHLLSEDPTMILTMNVRINENTGGMYFAPAATSRHRQNVDFTIGLEGPMVAASMLLSRFLRVYTPLDDSSISCAVSSRKKGMQRLPRGVVLLWAGGGRHKISCALVIETHFLGSQSTSKLYTTRILPRTKTLILVPWSYMASYPSIQP